MTIEGRCLCGGLVFRASGPPKWVAHCHCSLCRRAHGAPYVTWVGYPEDAVEIVQDGTLATYRSSAEGRRRFCARCGSQVFFDGTRWPGEVHVARALLPDDAPIPEPQVHAYWDSRAPWVHVEDTLPKRP